MRTFRHQKDHLNHPRKINQLEQYGNSSESRIVPNLTTSLLLEEIEEEEAKLRIQKQQEKEEKIALAIQARKEMACQRLFSPFKSMRSCGKWTIKQLSLGKVETPLEIWIDDDDSRLRGMASCDSAWCRNCAKKRVAERALKISQYIMPIIQGEESGSVWFYTGTVPRHHDIDHQKLQTRRGAKAVKNALDYQVKKGRFSYQAVRSLDITFKPWLEKVYHCHYHWIIVFSDNPSPQEAYKRLVRPWLRAIKGTSSKSQDLQEIISEDEAHAKSRYVAKKAGLALGLEIASSATTKTGNKGISFAELLTLATDEKRESVGMYRRVYIEFLEGIKGSNTITFSRDWPEPESEEEEAAKLIISIPEYWESMVAASSSEITFILYYGYLWNRYDIIRDFERLMSCENREQLEELATAAGLTVFSRLFVWQRLMAHYHLILSE